MGCIYRAVHESVWFIWLNRFSGKTIGSNPVKIRPKTFESVWTGSWPALEWSIKELVWLNRFSWQNEKSGFMSLVQLSVQIRSKSFEPVWTGSWPSLEWSIKELVWLNRFNWENGKSGFMSLVQLWSSVQIRSKSFEPIRTGSWPALTYCRLCLTSCVFWRCCCCCCCRTWWAQMAPAKTQNSGDNRVPVGCLDRGSCFGRRLQTMVLAAAGSSGGGWSNVPQCVNAIRRRIAGASAQGFQVSYPPSNN